MEFLNTLSRDEMRHITGGGHCHFYCCSGGPGSCGSALPNIMAEAEEGNTNETCQAAGVSVGLESQCGEGEYLAALYFSGPPH